MRHLLIAICGLALAGVASAAGPYPAKTGLAASADNASVAGNNPAAMTRFDSRNMRFEVLSFFSESTWEGQVGGGPTFSSEDSGTTVIPSGNMVMPLKNDWYFGFTVLGSGFSDDFADDWPGRYFIDEYTMVYLSAFPSIAKKVTDKLSLAASLALSYTDYEQIKAVPNVDPGFGDGSLQIEADGTTVGFSLSSLYEFNDRTRIGVVYRSELDGDLEGVANFSGLGPTTESILDAAGLLGANINVTSRTPQAINAGIYHEFADGGAMTFDMVWSDFSEFKLSETYVNGNQFIDTSTNYDDIFAFSASYNRPISDRLRIGFGAMFVDDMVDDDQRTLTLRIDSLWTVGVGLEWEWTPTRIVNANLSYIQLGDAPVTSPTIPVIGNVTGIYTDRGTLFLELGMSFGTGTGPR